MENQQISMGDEVVDQVTGFQGVVTSWMKGLHGMDQLGVQPPCDKDGKIPDPLGVDMSTLRIITKGKVTVSDVTDEAEVKAQLGDEARDPITGLQGTVTTYTRYLNGCSRLGITPKLDKDGKVSDTYFFAGPRLELIKSSKKVEETPAKPKSGGPNTRLQRY
jgi:hypothetical protein